MPKPAKHEHNFQPTGPEQPIEKGWGDKTVVGYVTYGKCSDRLCGQHAKKERSVRGRYGDWELTRAPM